ncbi:hypothetical protein CVT25_010529 [Psilocybe cyanescens]|uniref:Anti-proliferative protein domain-containing protein n=1 Tax=Psilocybe cyanescens TaxID=93625 RepID=A0A409X2K4_PSICY|nr:hypothetical protein CVT25_010529 [Psilocybe cyanescens]
MSSIQSLSVPLSVDRAISFLTRPLILTQTPSLVSGIQTVLRATLGACYNPLLHSTLTLKLSAKTLPPRPILAACFTSGMYWVEWMQLLGGREFDLVIEAQSVKVVYHGAYPQTVVVWSEVIPAPARPTRIAHLHFDEPQVPISKLGQQSVMQATLLATVDSAVARAKTRTVAQQLLESEREEQEADEILAMISKCAITTPTPTSERFTIDPPKLIMSISTTSFPSPLSSPELASSPDSSRPSSRSSTFSTFSFSSDDDESISSASSFSSFDFFASTKPSSTFAASTKTFNEHAPAFVPRQKRAPQVFVDNKKKDVTKYLYQGGVSTVLTGGVMLGAAAAAPAKTNQVPKYRAPVGGKKFSPTQNAASANTWRRAARV